MYSGLNDGGIKKLCSSPCARSNKLICPDCSQFPFPTSKTGSNISHCWQQAECLKQSAYFFRLFLKDSYPICYQPSNLLDFHLLCFNLNHSVYCKAFLMGFNLKLFEREFLSFSSFQFSLIIIIIYYL